MRGLKPWALASMLGLAAVGAADAQPTECPTGTPNTAEPSDDVQLFTSTSLAMDVSVNRYGYVPVPVPGIAGCSDTVAVYPYPSSRDGNRTGVRIQGFVETDGSRDYDTLSVVPFGPVAKTWYLRFWLAEEYYDGGREFKLQATVITPEGSFLYPAGETHNLIHVTVADTGPAPEPTEPPNNPATGRIEIRGELTTGQTLTIDHSRVTDSDGKPTAESAFTYRWRERDQSTDLGNERQLSLDSSKAGKRLEGCVSFTDDLGHDEGPLCAETGRIVQPPNGSWEAPSLAVARTGGVYVDENGDPATTVKNTWAVVGGTLVAVEYGLRDPDGFNALARSRAGWPDIQWVYMPGEVPIPGETADDYSITSRDLGRRLAVIASWTDGNGVGERVRSATVGPVRATGGQLTGTPRIVAPNGVRIGETLRASTSGLTSPNGRPSAFLYQWRMRPFYDTGAPYDVDGATASTFEIEDGVAGYRVQLAVGNADYPEGEYVLSAWSDRIEGEPNATGTPTVSSCTGCGSVIRPGHGLSVSLGSISDPDGLSTPRFRYQWLYMPGEVPIPVDDATGDANYAVRTQDAGRQIAARVSFNDDRGTEEALLSNAVTVASATGKPVIRDAAGTYQVGNELTVDVSAIRDSHGFDRSALTYRWRRGGVTVATTAAYTPTAADVGHSLVVEVAFSDNAGTPEAVSSDPTPAIRTAGAAVGSITITGTVRVGEDLTADLSGVTDPQGLPSNIATHLVWYRAPDTEVARGSATYRVAAADEGARIVVALPAGFPDADGNTDNAEIRSAPTRVVQRSRTNRPPTGTVTILGIPDVNGTLTANPVIFEPDDVDDGRTDFSYKWLANGKSVGTGPTYQVKEADRGKQVKVRVEYVDDGGTPEAVESSPVWIYELPDATGKPRIVGEPRIDSTLSVDLRAISDRRGIDRDSFTYQWVLRGRISGDIAGATDAEYTIGADDHNGQLQVRVKFRDGRGRPEELTSDFTELVRGVIGTTPRLSGAPFVGETLEIYHDNLDVTPHPDDFFFWRRAMITSATGTLISGASGKRSAGRGAYTLTPADVGYWIYAEVRWNGTTTARRSDFTPTAIRERAHLITGEPNVVGPARVGERLVIYDTSTIRHNGRRPRRFDYQWLHMPGEIPIDGADGAYYWPTADDEGKLISVRVSWTELYPSSASDALVCTTDPETNPCKGSAFDSTPLGPIGPRQGAPGADPAADFGNQPPAVEIVVDSHPRRPDGTYLVPVGATVELTAAARDADAGELSYEWAATSGRLGTPSGMLTTWTPTEPGVHPIAVRVTDGAGAGSTASIEIEVAQAVPALPLAGLIVLAVLLWRRGRRGPGSCR